MSKRAVWVATERQTDKGPRTFWTKIGEAHENRDGSTSVRLDALPLNGTLIVRDVDDEKREPRGDVKPGLEAMLQRMKELSSNKLAGDEEDWHTEEDDILCEALAAVAPAESAQLVVALLDEWRAVRKWYA